MSPRALVGVILLSILWAPAMAQQSTRGGETSGAGVGGNVAPSTVLQKRFEGRSVGVEEPRGLPDSSGVAAGAPGVEGKPGTQSGGAPRNRESGERVY